MWASWTSSGLARQLAEMADVLVLISKAKEEG
jgi:hypothetical protein